MLPIWDIRSQDYNEGSRTTYNGPSFAMWAVLVLCQEVGGLPGRDLEVTVTLAYKKICAIPCLFGL